MSAQQREVQYATTSTTEIPQTTCRRCEDWTTVIHRNNVISPCPACRPEEYETWLAEGNRGPAS